MANSGPNNLGVIGTVAGAVLAGSLASSLAPGSGGATAPASSNSVATAASMVHVAPSLAADTFREVIATATFGGERPVAIFHAFDQQYADVAGFVCDLAKQGYSHVQIAPAQKSNPDTHWWARFQPIDYRIIEGRGSEGDLSALVQKAHGCGIRVIADVVFNHMADMPAYSNLASFPSLTVGDFHKRCNIDNYNDRNQVVNCWLGGLPDLDQSQAEVQAAHQAHLQKLVALGIDGFRFDAAKHMLPDAVRGYISFVNQQTHGQSWNYLEVIEDPGTPAEDYDGIAAVTDLVLYGTMKSAFTLGGDLRSLRVPAAVNDPRSVTFGRNHDNLSVINGDNNTGAINPYTDATDSYLATAYVLARESGTPLVLNLDNFASPFIRFGTQFRQIVTQRGRAGALVHENVLGVVDSGTLLVMERGAEGLLVVNKAADAFDVPTLDMTLTDLEGCYNELRNNFTIAIERRPDRKKYVTRWGTWARGGMQVQARDALFFVRQPWTQCQSP